MPKMSHLALNRALLARQGLITPLTDEPVQVVERIGAIQAQAWTSVPVAFWSRMESLDLGKLWSLFDQAELLIGPMVRGTIHVVSAREYPQYAASVALAGLDDWWRSKHQLGPESRELLTEVRAFTAEPRSADQITAFIEEWVTENPGVVRDRELEAQRESKWRPFRATTSFLRAPLKGAFTATSPTAYRASPGVGEYTEAELVNPLIDRHLRAFGPAGAEDIAYWLGWKVPVIRTALMAREDLISIIDEAGRRLYDLPDAPRPDADIEVPVRFLPAFDSVLLACAPTRRERIMPERHRKSVYGAGNLRVRPTVLVDGKVAGTWTSTVRKQLSTLDVTLWEAVTKTELRQIEAEGRRLAEFSGPGAADYDVTVTTARP
ncbi:winged helix DNA-binding domain-containing protein [Pseudonocardiaceae bacterium YIM PH 21723]|nr:winged helix DNA-binding domain-containing protein [Pseudonocardiaceae bacterium YIM PH 21723]